MHSQRVSKEIMLLIHNELSTANDKKYFGNPKYKEAFYLLNKIVYNKKLSKRFKTIQELASPPRKNYKEKITRNRKKIFTA